MTGPVAPRSMRHGNTRIDVYCRVIDNFGDAGVCWRLARQLTVEHGCTVRVFVDRLDVMLRVAGAAQRWVGQPASVDVDGVLLTDWPQQEGAAHENSLPDVVIAAFGCTLPDGLRNHLAPPRAQRPCWINLEYLSAEGWIDDHHGLPSIKPSDRAVEWFFFPGFSPRSGGLLRERTAWVAHNEAHAPAPGTSAQPLRVSVFCYPQAPLQPWLDQLASGPRPVQVLLADGVAQEAVAQLFGHPLLAGQRATRGAAECIRLPWLTQPDYDALLRGCDLNIVRGEDSFVRAHWAARPLLWQPYPQEGGTHLLKLQAWLDRVVTVAPEALPDQVERHRAIDALAALHRAWNGAPDPSALAGAWDEYCAALPALATLHRRFAASLASQPDLATRLIEFIDAPARC